MPMTIVERTKKISAVLLKPLLKNSRFFIVMLCIGLLSVMVVHRGMRHISVFELFFETYLLTALVSCFPRFLGNITKGVCYVLAYVLGIVDMFVFCRLDFPLGPAFLRLCLQTNRQEASEAIQSYVTWDTVMSPVLLFLVILALHLLSYRIKEFRLPHRINNVILLCLAPLLLFSGALSIKNEWFIIRNMLAYDGDDMERQAQLPYDGGFYLPIYRFLYAAKAMNIDELKIRRLIDNSSRVKVGRCAYTVPNIVLVVGESYNRHHSSLYGYPLKTTPLQEELAKKDELIAFTNVISPANNTSQSFHLAFSLYATGCEGQWESYPLLLQLFKQSGYNVTFITNQYVKDIKAVIWDYNGSRFLNTPELSERQFSHRNTNKHPYDMGLLEDYDSLKQFETSHNLTVFHTYGLHFMYDVRYPNNERRFYPRHYKRPDLSEFDVDNLSHYDNAVLYNDKVLAEIVKRFADRDAIVIFMPDHGEMVYDNCDQYARNLNPKTRNEITQQFEIPFWIWCSPMFKEQHAELFEKIKKARNLPFMTDNIDQMMVSLGGISTDFYRPEDDPLNEKYDRKRKRIIMDGIDYDKIIRGQ